MLLFGIFHPVIIQCDNVWYFNYPSAKLIVTVCWGWRECSKYDIWPGRLSADLTRDHIKKCKEPPGDFMMRLAPAVFIIITSQTWAAEILKLLSSREREDSQHWYKTRSSQARLVACTTYAATEMCNIEECDCGNVVINTELSSPQATTHDLYRVQVHPHSLDATFHDAAEFWHSLSDSRMFWIWGDCWWQF